MALICKKKKKKMNAIKSFYSLTDFFTYHELNKFCLLVNLYFPKKWNEVYQILYKILFLLDSH